MIYRGKILSAVAAVLIVSGVCCADMRAVGLQPSEDSIRVDSHHPISASPEFENILSDSVIDSGPEWSFGPLPLGTEQQGVEHNVTRLTQRGSGSLSICLYALMGFGVLRSAPHLRKFSLGFVPEWYHAEGPLQIGHKHAIGPDCLSTAKVCCFIQPQNADDPISPRFLNHILAPLVRASVFTETLVSRGPPSFIC